MRANLRPEELSLENWILEQFQRILSKEDPTQKEGNFLKCILYKKLSSWSHSCFKQRGFFGDESVEEFPKQAVAEIL